MVSYLFTEISTHVLLNGYVIKHECGIYRYTTDPRYNCGSYMPDVSHAVQSFGLCLGTQWSGHRQDEYADTVIPVSC